MLKFRDAKAKRDLLKSQLAEAQAELDSTERGLVELLTAQGKEATAKYEGLGFVSLTKPELYASCRKEYEEKLFAYLASIGRSDLVRASVHPRSLSGFVKELLEEGNTIPEFVSYYLRPSVKFYAR